MQTIKGQCGFALAVVFGFTASAVRAEMITPNSISNPPSAVGSANGTPVYAGNLVNTQYMGMGLGFSNSQTAITSLNGVPVWAPVSPVAIPAVRVSGGPPVNFPVGAIDYYNSWYEATLNSLATRNPMTVSSLTVETIGNPGFLSLGVFGRNGLALNIAPVVQSLAGTNGEEIWKFTGSGIWGFTAIEAVIDPPGPGKITVNPAWGVAAVSFTPPSGQTPEPSSLVLAGLGALGLAARFTWRRLRMAA
ncbi:MAG: PEP-CTERM sorting domain-containing protein [Gemmataceae bacterium]